MLEYRGTGASPRGGVRTMLVTIAGIAAVLAAGSAPALAGPHYTSFDVAGAASTAGYTINSSGVVGGIWTDENGYKHGFVRAPDGTISSFGPKNAVQTEGVAINDAGEAAGTYEDSQNREHGFIRTPDGTIIRFDPPRSQNTVALSINNSGVVSGYAGDRGRAFIRNPDGSFITYSVPRAIGTTGGSINDNGDIAGYYIDKKDDYAAHGFIRHADGSFTTFDVPGASQTWGGDINAKGVVVGSYTDSRDVNHCYIRMTNGVIATCEPPETSQEPAYGSFATGISSTGMVVGTYYDANTFAQRGFLRRRDGTFKTFAVRHQATFATGVNDDGVVTGFDGSNGFVRTP